MMSASNLAVCVGPSLLWSNNSIANNNANPALALSTEAAASKQVPALVATLIDKCAVLFGSETVCFFSFFVFVFKFINPNLSHLQATLLVDNSCLESVTKLSSSLPAGGLADRRLVHKEYHNKAPVQKHMARLGLLQHDSGNEESDSLHSLHHCKSARSQLFKDLYLKPRNNTLATIKYLTTADVMRRDDSSIDSLERELLRDVESLDHHHHHAMRRDKMSVTNLSRDSGLTLSDTQLYTPDEDMGSESSSSGRGSDRDKSARNIRDVMRPRTNQVNRNERSMYVVPLHSKSTPRLDSFGAHGKVSASYSAATSASYTPVYDHHRPDVYRKLSDDVVYAVPKATPTVILGEEYQVIAPAGLGLMSDY